MKMPISMLEKKLIALSKYTDKYQGGERKISTDKDDDPDMQTAAEAYKINPSRVKRYLVLGTGFLAAIFSYFCFSSVVIPGYRRYAAENQAMIMDAKLLLLKSDTAVKKILSDSAVDPDEYLKVEAIKKRMDEKSRFDQYLDERILFSFRENVARAERIRGLTNEFKKKRDRYGPIAKASYEKSDETQLIRLKHGLKEILKSYNKEKMKTKSLLELIGSVNSSLKKVHKKIVNEAMAMLKSYDRKMDDILHDNYISRDDYEILSGIEKKVGNMFYVKTLGLGKQLSGINGKISKAERIWKICSGYETLKDKYEKLCVMGIAVSDESALKKFKEQLGRLLISFKKEGIPIRSLEQTAHGIAKDLNKIGYDKKINQIQKRYKVLVKKGITVSEEKSFTKIYDELGDIRKKYNHFGYSTYHVDIFMSSVRSQLDKIGDKKVGGLFTSYKHTVRRLDSAINSLDIGKIMDYKRKLEIIVNDLSGLALSGKNIQYYKKIKKENNYYDEVLHAKAQAIRTGLNQRIKMIGEEINQKSISGTLTRDVRTSYREELEEINHELENNQLLKRYQRK